MAPKTKQAQQRFPGISPKAYEHPADRAATAALRQIPLVEPAIKRLGDIAEERHLRQLLMGNAVRLGENQVPSVWAAHRSCYETLDLDPVPALYTTQNPIGNAVTVGRRQPVVYVSSALLSSFEPEEVRAVLAHESGHVLSEHVYYTSVLQLLTMILSIGVPGPLVLAGLPLRALYLVLLEWARSAELSSDRAAAIVVGDPLVVCRVLMRMAGGAVPGMSLDAFIAQAAEYHDEDDVFVRGSRFIVEIGRTHPFPVKRVHELVNWVSSGDYDRIRSGEYVHRGQEPGPSAEFEAAADHYRERFLAVIRRSAGSVQKVTDKLFGWLEGNPPSDEDEPVDVDADADA